MPAEDYHIQIRRPGSEPERVALDPAVHCTLGRAPTNSVILSDASISRFHAEIYHQNGEYWIRDLGSKNGTKVGSKRIDGPAKLSPGDRLQLGSVQLLVLAGKDGAPSDDSASARVADVAAPVNVQSISVDDISRSGAIDTKSFDVGIQPERFSHFIQALDRFSQALLAYRPLGELFQFVVQLTADLLKADRTTILLREGTLDTLVPKAISRTGSRAAAEEEIVVSRSIARMAVDQRQAILTRDAQSDTRFRAQESVIQQRIHSAMCAPLWHDGDVLGLLYVDKVATISPFEESELRLLTLIAHLTAVKIRETEIYEAQQAQQVELQKAAGLQQALLPHEPRRVGGIEIAGRNVPSQDVGGDYFDFVDGEGSRLVVGLGDVAGKGMPAALLMAHLAASVRAQVESERPLTEVMRRLNRSVHHHVRGERFITLVLAEVDTETGKMVYVNGGHNPPWLLKTSGHLESLTDGGLLLGIMPEAVYESGSTQLEPGDILIFYSDGVTEARNLDEEEFGEERLLSFLREAREMDPEVMVEALIERVRSFSMRPKPTDDVTVVVITRRT